MRKYRRIHNRIKRHRMDKFVNEILISILYYLCPIFVLIGGMFGTFKLIIYKGYNTESGLWNISNAFYMAAVGLCLTIVVTVIVTKIVSKIVDYLLSHR